MRLNVTAPATWAPCRPCRSSRALRPLASRIDTVPSPTPSDLPPQVVTVIRWKLMSMNLPPFLVHLECDFLWSWTSPQIGSIRRASLPRLLRCLGVFRGPKRSGGRRNTPSRKLRRGKVPQGAVRPALVVLPTPRLDLLPGIGQCQEPVLVETLLAASARDPLLAPPRNTKAEPPASGPRRRHKPVSCRPPWQ